MGGVDREAPPRMKDLAKGKSFRAEMQEYTLVTTGPGGTSGKRICRRKHDRLAPSMYAASSSASGTPFTNPRSIRIAKGGEKATRGSIGEPGVFGGPKSRISGKRGW
ncbi:hypothetical protein GCM10011578_084410 [Streptomyces fuscichromogenes]|uniref:Uncharacterized protein n=1 Tax=Streptomyces fuscichromogenes TaxID=1324013 RepID=A0A918CWA0_9ACTN|nr:hypothetical protein GCM10011578_084410 [Streptomyces fuscichromogenes]